MSMFRPRINNSTFPGPINPNVEIPPEPAAHPSNATADASPDPNPQQPEPAIPPLAPAEPAAPTDRHADLVCLADIPPRPIDWLWPGRLAYGTLAMLSGDPGSGKTWVALAIAAALSRGRIPATNHSLHPCTVLYASAANGAADLIRPRFAQLDGDPARLILLRGVLTASDQPASLSLRDTPMLEDALHRTQARLLIIDPLHSYLWALDRHRAHNSAHAFDSLARLAEKHRCCILLVRHLRKRGRGLTAIELSAAVRTEFIATSSPDAPTRPALVQVKSNLGPLAPSLGYLIDNSGAFSWTGPTALTPEEVMMDRPIDAGLPKRKSAAEWLRQYLHQGERPQPAVEYDALQDGLSVITLRRAKYDLGVVSSRETYTGTWFWALPENESATDAVVP